MQSAFSLLCLVLLTLARLSAQTEWMFFHASDGVGDFRIADGFSWVSAGSGLSKINLATGEKTVFNSTNSDIGNHMSNVLAVDASGGVWMTDKIGEAVHLRRFDGTNWQTWTDINGDAIASINSISPAADGKVWLLGWYGTNVLYFFENGVFTPVPQPDPIWYISKATASRATVTADNHLWAVLRDSLYQNFRLGEFDGNDWTLHDLSPFVGSLGTDAKVIGDSQGNVYVLVTKLSGTNLLKYDGLTWTPMTAPATGNDYNNSNRPLYADAQNRVWIGLWNNSFIRFDGQDWTTIDLAAMGLTGGHPDGLEIDGDGNWRFIYVLDSPYSNNKSLYLYDGNTINQVDLSNSDLPTNHLGDVFIDPLQNKWVGTIDGLARFDGTEWQEYAFLPNGGGFYLSAADHWGNLWFNGADAGALGRFDGLAFTKIDVAASNGEPFNFAGNLVSDKNGTLYLATGELEVLRYKNGNITYLDDMSYTDDFGFNEQDFSDFVAIDSSDRVWSIGYALHRLDGDTWTEIPLWTQDFVGVNSIFLDKAQRVWVNFGIILPGSSADFYVYDGTSWNYFVFPFSITSYPDLDAQGNMWVSSNAGIHHFDGTNWTNFNASNSLLPSNHVSDLKMDRQGNIWLTFQNAGIAVFNPNGITDISALELPTLSGSIYRDWNGNQQQDAGDLPLAFHKVLLLPDSLTTFSNFDGSYQFRLPEGNYEVQYFPVPNWQTEAGAPASHLVALQANGTSGLDFRVEAYQEVRQTDIRLTGGFPRCNFEVNYWLHWRNVGTLASDGNARLLPDPLSEFVESNPPPGSVQGDTLIWAFDDLLPYESRQVHLRLKMPDEMATDSALLFLSSAEIIENQQLVALDSHKLEQVVMCAFDPNDKLAQPSGEVQDNRSLFADALEFTIRFQNTGNDTAFSVVIRDTIDAQLDLNTLEVQASSHPMSARFEQNGALEFRFYNILLPDSTTNEPASHGFVRYAIRAKAGLPSPAIIENTAYIYFDLNQPVVTNTTLNELTESFVAVLERTKDRFPIFVHPNPAHDWAQVSLTDPLPETFALKLSDANGKLVFYKEMSGLLPERLNLGHLPSGTYWILIENEGKFGAQQFVKL